MRKSCGHPQSAQCPSCKLVKPSRFGNLAVAGDIPNHAGHNALPVIRAVHEFLRHRGKSNRAYHFRDCFQLFLCGLLHSWFCHGNLPGTPRADRAGSRLVRSWCQKARAVTRRGETQCSSPEDLTRARHHEKERTRETKGERWRAARRGGRQLATVIPSTWMYVSGISAMVTPSTSTVTVPGVGAGVGV